MAVDSTPRTAAQIFGPALVSADLQVKEPPLPSTAPADKAQPRLSWSRAALAHVISVLPSVPMLWFCVMVKDAILAVYAFHACMLFSLLGFCALFQLDPRTFVPTLADVRRNLAVCRLSFISISVGGVAIYMGCRSGSAPGQYLGVPLAELRQLIDAFGIHEPPLQSVGFAIYFTIFNPLLEEVFWRTFLYRELGAERMCAKVLLAHNFSVYHIFITSSLMPLWFAIFVGYPFLVGFGLALDRICRDKRFGVVTAIGVHAGMDLAAAFWIMDLRFGWFDFLQR
ncbi:hypothetical protein T492DRAFT_1049123 [Pavlovales sp. CCMP2436]|nr:hypothetical protein T492DRAFT_1049123 [Pavlovales sp. CCMP2436]|mmetsp:Transcript_4429/g.11314  ORF Transcript_4429/g.11314 Transcript_4429/m.11314 type:complete len:283 (-) Transcript_4429:98-946(-)